VLVATAELRGTTEPCGCNSDPLGDLARVVPLLNGGLLLDAGDLTYPVDAISPARRPQADLKAQAIASIYKEADAALGPSDLLGPLAPPRQACNVQNPAIVAPHVRVVNGLRVGVFGVSDPQRMKGAGDPAAAATKAVAALEADRAQVIVGLLALNRADAHDLMAKVAGIDFGIVGLDVEEGMPEAEPVNGGFLVSPADQGRRVARIAISPVGATGRVHPAAFDGAAGHAQKLARTDKRIKQLAAQLTAWQSDKTADPAFVAARKDELGKLTADRADLAARPPAPPSTPYFTYALVDVKRALQRDPAVALRLRELDHSIGAANLAAAKSDVVPPADKGKPTFVGQAACAKCHKAAVEFWTTTHHANAWKTLVDVDKQYNYDCIGCHVTGWQEPGGSTMGTAEKQALVNVQCETCHGAGSTHVAESGLDDPKTMHDPDKDLCRNSCHTMEHSDTFTLEPYLRDILGAGHGEKRRKALGDGPTGHELRQAAMAQAR
jgi:hypothetical protein